MNSSDIAPMVVAVFLIVSVAATILLRPITKKLGTYLEVLAEERRRSLSEQPLDRSDSTRLTAAVEALESRLALLEQNQDFTNRLLSDRAEPKPLSR